MTARGDGRVELRVPVDRKARWEEAARRSRTDLSGWARRQLDEAADALLGREDAEPGPPTREQIRVSQDALGAMGPERAEKLRARVHAARRTPWRARS
jgi:hypothetical protein